MNPLMISEFYTDQKVSSELYTDICQQIGVREVVVTLIPGRCGSTFFAQSISAIGVCGTGDEVFNERTAPEWRKVSPELPVALKKAMAFATKGGITWFQSAPHRFAHLAKVLDENILKTWIYTVIFRRDILAQAISYIYAVKTGVWHSSDGHQVLSFHIDREELLATVEQWIRHLENFEGRIRELVRKYSAQPPLVQYYEDIVSAPRPEIVRFLRFCSVAYDGNALQHSLSSEVRIAKDRDLDIYNTCLDSIPWIERLLNERKRMASPLP